MGQETPSIDDRAIPWTLRQRRALLIVFSGVFIYLAYAYWNNRAYVPDPIPSRSPLADRLADRIDPNTADLATLSALPRLGKKRAQTIVDFRDRVQKREPGGTVFTTEDDLLKIKGIGVAMVANLRPYLIFPGAPTTQPVE